MEIRLSAKQELFVEVVTELSGYPRSGDITLVVVPRMGEGYGVVPRQAECA